MSTPVTPKPTSGREDIRAVLRKEEVPTRAAVDYSEDEPAPEVVTPEAPVTPEVTPAPVVDAKQKEIEAKIAALEAERTQLLAIQAQQNQQIIKSQEMIAEALKPKAPEKPIYTQEQIAEIYQNDPLKAIAIITEQTATRIRDEFVAEQTAVEAVQSTQQTFQQNVQKFNENIQKVTAENKELADPNHELTKIYTGLADEMPYLLRIPEGPLKAIQIAKERYELQQLKAKPVAVQPVTPAAETDKEQEVPEVRETPRATQMVSGSSRGVPPTTTVKLTEEQKVAARKMRLSPEEYSKFQGNTSKHLQKEVAPRRRQVV